VYGLRGIFEDSVERAGSQKNDKIPEIKEQNESGEDGSSKIERDRK
jgi:hypothetical protein